MWISSNVSNLSLTVCEDSPQSSSQTCNIGIQISGRWQHWSVSDLAFLRRKQIIAMAMEKTNWNYCPYNPLGLDYLMHWQRNPVHCWEDADLMVSTWRNRIFLKSSFVNSKTKGPICRRYWMQELEMTVWTPLNGLSGPAPSLSLSALTYGSLCGCDVLYIWKVLFVSIRTMCKP